MVWSMVTYVNPKQLNKRELYTSLNQPKNVVFQQYRKRRFPFGNRLLTISIVHTQIIYFQAHSHSNQLTLF